MTIKSCTTFVCDRCDRIMEVWGTSIIINEKLICKDCITREEKDGRKNTKNDRDTK